MFQFFFSSVVNYVFVGYVIFEKSFIHNKFMCFFLLENFTLVLMLNLYDNFSLVIYTFRLRFVKRQKLVLKIECNFAANRSFCISQCVHSQNRKYTHKTGINKIEIWLYKYPNINKNIYVYTYTQCKSNLVFLFDTCI